MPPSRIRDSLHGFKTTCQMLRDQPEVRKCPTLGTGNIRKCPTVARGGGGWALLELTDALAFWKLVVGTMIRIVLTIEPDPDHLIESIILQGYFRHYCKSLQRPSHSLLKCSRSLQRGAISLQRSSRILVDPAKNPFIDTWYRTPHQILEDLQGSALLRSL